MIHNYAKEWVNQMTSLVDNWNKPCCTGKDLEKNWTKIQANIAEINMTPGAESKSLKKLEEKLDILKKIFVA